jgi:protein-S-isoprenylcysteine O-methyltransferase Ste14
VAFYGVIVCWWLFGLTFWLRGRVPGGREAKRAPTSYLGMLLQSVGYLIVWFFPLWRHQISGIGTGRGWFAWTMTGVTVAIAGASAWLVIAAARRLGKQWALAARVLEDHALIQEGPYRFVRNPIYTGMFGMLIATGMAVGQWIPLLCASVLFLIGTWIRIRIEERLLREAFGSRFDDYRRKVPALIPGIY